LAAVGLAFSTLGALALAVIRTLRPRSRLAALAGSAAQVLSNLPVFLCVYGAVVGGNAFLAWGAREGFWSLPAWFPFPSQSTWFPWLAAAAILALGDGLLVDLYQRFQDELRRASTGDFLLGVRLLGMSVPRAVARGFLPGAASHVCRRIGFVLGSMVVLESAVGWPGLGYLAWRSAAERDLPVLLAVALVFALVVRLAVMTAEWVWYTADPRKRTAG
jgi:peptide/nickel transport system permease protein